MKPAPLAPGRSFGFGDRLGFGGAAALAALRDSGFQPILAQQSPRELRDAGRTPVEVLAAAGDPPIAWGAEADGVTTAESAAAFVAAGFTRLSVDPCEYVVEKVDEFSADELAAAESAAIEDGALPADWRDLYPAHALPPNEAAPFTEDQLVRAAVKQAWAVSYAEEIVATSGGAACELEINLARAVRPTSPLEHWWLATEARRRGLRLVAIAPRWPGMWESVAEYDGDLARFESTVRAHVEITSGHQISCGEIEGKEALWPLLGRGLGERLHVKTSALSMLAALRMVVREERVLFRELLLLAQERFAWADRGRISLGEDEVRFLPDVSDDALEAIFLDDARGRQLFEVTFPSLWGDAHFPSGGSVRERLTPVLTSGGYAELLQSEIARILAALRAD